MALRLNRAIRPLHCLSRTTLVRPTQPRSHFDGNIVTFTRNKTKAKTFVARLEKSSKQLIEERDYKVPAEDLAQVQRTLFLNHLPKSVNHAELKKWCRAMGVNPERVLMPVQRYSLRNPGFAFIELKTVHALQDAQFKLNAKFFGTSDISVSKTRHTPQFLMKMYLKAPPQVFPELDKNYTVQDMLKPIHEGRRVYVGRKGLQSSASPGQLRKSMKDLLSGYSLEALSKVNIVSYEQFAFADAATREEADRIVAGLHGEKMLGIELRVERVLIDDPAHGWDRFIEIDRINKKSLKTSPEESEPTTQPESTSSIESDTAAETDTLSPVESEPISQTDTTTPSESELSILPPEEQSAASQDNSTSAPNEIEAAMAKDTENPIPAETDPSIQVDALPTLTKDEADPVPEEAELSILPDSPTTTPQDEDVLMPTESETASSQDETSAPKVEDDTVPNEAELSILPGAESTGQQDEEVVPRKEEDAIPEEPELSILPDAGNTGPQDEEVLTPTKGTAPPS